MSHTYPIPEPSPSPLASVMGWPNVNTKSHAQSQLSTESFAGVNAPSISSLVLAVQVDKIHFLSSHPNIQESIVWLFNLYVTGVNKGHCGYVIEA